MTNNEFAIFLLDRISTLICHQQQNLPTTTLRGYSSQLVDHAYEHERESGDITLPRNSSSATNQRGGAVGKSFMLLFSGRTWFKFLMKPYYFAILILPFSDGHSVNPRSTKVVVIFRNSNSFTQCCCVH